jgi:hypothetical protein
MKGLTGAILIAAMVFAGPAFAQFYKYMNKQGDARFTDASTQVPRDQRAAAQSYYESQAGAKSAAAESSAVTEEKPAAPSPPAASAAAADPIEGTRTRLEALKKEVEAEYQLLMKEQDRLAKEKGAQKNREETNTYTEGVEAFNQRAEIFEKKNNDLRKAIEGYNALVAEANAKSAAAPK